MEKRTYQLLNSLEMEDLSILQPQAQSSIAGFLEAKNAFENGTNEVRRLLLDECNLIYECNQCRNMFRNLNTFITHKRIYCCDNSSSDARHHDFTDEHAALPCMSETIETIENVDRTNQHNSSTTLSSQSTLDELEELNKTIENLKFEKSNETEQNESQKILIRKNDLLKTSLKIKANSVDLSTSISSSGSGSSSTETKQQQKKRKTKIAETQLNDATAKEAETLKKNATESKELFNCKMCNQRFDLQLSLKQHLQKKHSKGVTFAYKCPWCERVLHQSSAVIRHLTDDHKKSPRTIRLMREAIQKHRTAAAAAATATSSKSTDKSPCRELKRLKLLNENAIKEQSELQNQKLISKCIYCDKPFERRAALSAHMVNCQPKQELTTSLDLKVEKQHGLRAGKNTAGSVVSKPVEEQEYIAKLNELFENLEKSTTGNNLQTVRLTDELEEADDAQAILQSGDVCVPNELTTVELNDTNVGAADSTQKEREVRMRNTKELLCRCKICNKQFNALSNLRRHISMFHYRARKFGCTLCDYRAFRRYDIVNHLIFVHKMEGDREAMSIDYVTVHEVNYSKDDMDGDIVVVDSAEKKLAMEQMTKAVPTKTYEKRAHRKRQNEVHAALSTSAAEEAEVKATPPIKLRRTLSQNVNGSNSSSSERLLLKRPIRNRIKAENKDFVYELSHLDNKTETMQPERENLRSSKRRSIQSYATLVDKAKDVIAGTSQRIALLCVNQGLAKAATPPELPAERPQIRPRHSNAHRNDAQHVPVIEASEFKANLFDDSYLDKLAMQNTSEFKMKPRLAMQHSALSSLLQKVDMSRPNNNNSNKDNGNANSISVKSNEQISNNLLQKIIKIEKNAEEANCANTTTIVTSTTTTTTTTTMLLETASSFDAAEHDKQQTSPSANVVDAATLQLTFSNGGTLLTELPTNTLNNCEEIQHTSPPAALFNRTTATTAPAAPKKRITLLQRLAENREKQQQHQQERESFLRSALEQ